MIYIYNLKLTWNAGYLGDLYHPFEWLTMLLMSLGQLPLPLSDNGTLSEAEWAPKLLLFTSDWDFL